MPTVSKFYGIVIRMYYDEHPPPHFHAYSGEYEASVSIDTFDVLEGKLPRRALSLIMEWASEHRGELRDNWRRAEAHQPLEKIAPLI